MSEEYLPVIRNPLQRFYDARYTPSPESSTSTLAELPSSERREIERREETSNIELFYDLFFVANLTVFTYIHEINSLVAFQQYAGFFVILWMTWYNVSLYDARFAMDCLAERGFKALHFGVMIWFASIGPQFSKGRDPNSFRAFTLILMGSRLVLMLQYLEIWYFARDHVQTQHGKAGKTPILIVSGTYFVSSMVYLGLYWTFETDPHGMVPIPNPSETIWYVLAAVEAVVVTATNDHYKLVRSQPTHISERMCLLTLIILGEGVIGIAKQCQLIAKAELFIWAPSAIVNVMCATLVLYLIYMLYFDWAQKHWLSEDKLGFRPQLWSLLHFAFHLALVMAIEGINQCIIWRAALEARSMIEDTWEHWGANIPANDVEWSAAYTAWTNMTSITIGQALGSSKDYSSTVQRLNWAYNATEALYMIKPPATDDQARVAPLAFEMLYDLAYKATFSIAGYGASPKLNETLDEYSNPYAFDISTYPPHHDDLVAKYLSLFRLTFVILFVCLGMVVILCSGIAMLSNQGMELQHRVRLCCSAFIGFVIASLAFMAIHESAAYVDFSNSAWLLPSITIILLIVTACNNVKLSMPMLRPNNRDIEDKI